MKLLAIATLLLFAACRSPGEPTVVLGNSSGARRLLGSPSGTWGLAETSPDPTMSAPAPVPQIEVFDPVTRRIDRRIAGWSIGGPTDDGAVLYLEQVDATYRIRSSAIATPGDALAPPPGHWLPALGVRAGAGLGAIVLWEASGAMPTSGDAPVRLWIAAIDPATLHVVASTERTLVARRDIGVYLSSRVVAGARGDLFLLDASGTLTCLALDGLAVRWTTQVDVRELAVDAVSSSGNGARVAVALDAKGRDDSGELAIVDAASGAIVDSVDATAIDPVIGANLGVLAPVPGRDAIGLVVFTTHGDLAFGTETDADAAFTLDLETHARMRIAELRGHDLFFPDALLLGHEGGGLWIRDRTTP